MPNHALQQIGWQGESVNNENWQEIIRVRLEQADWNAVIADVRPFVELPQELNMLTRETLLGLLS
jgi:hypothetical protein